MKERLFTAEVVYSDAEETLTGSKKSLRPSSFAEYLGQKKVVDNVSSMVSAAKLRGEAMDHVLFSGPPGLGKTSLALLLAQEMDVRLQVISGPALEKKGDLASILSNLRPRDLLFIDEIHRLPITVEEMLYSAMEDFRLDIVIGQGPAARTMQLELSPFTLVGATTKSGSLSHPLRDRFVSHLHFDYYSPDEIAQILLINAQKYEMELERKALILLSSCCRGTPRIANRLLKRVRDFAQLAGRSRIEVVDIEKVMNVLEIDRHGLDRMDRKILRVIAEQYKGGPVGIEALAATLAEERGTLEDVYEPFLLKEGFLLRTSRGREVSEKALDLLANSVELR